MHKGFHDPVKGELIRLTGGATTAPILICQGRSFSMCETVLLNASNTHHVHELLS